MRAIRARRDANEGGSALVYILIAIALLAALTIAFMEPSSQQTSSQNSFKTLTEVQSQANIIRAAVQECVLVYPRGDSAIPDAGVRKNYPIDPDSTYYTTATPGRSGDQLVRNIRCPGNNPGGGNVDDHELIFVGGEGKFLPPPPDLFEDWQYYNGADGVFFWTSTDKTDAYLVAALAKMDENYAECEADIIDTSVAPAGAKKLESGNTLECAAGSVCFRVWMVKNGTAVFPGDADSDESGC